MLDSVARMGDWDLYVARRPKCYPQSAQGLSVLQSTSMRNSPNGTCNIASGVRSLNCVGPRTAPKLQRGVLCAILRAGSEPADDNYDRGGL
eukprot:11507161-Alexandrium_andersonii.AAC.1